MLWLMKQWNWPNSVKKAVKNWSTPLLRRILREGWPDITSIKRKNKRRLHCIFPSGLASCQAQEEYGEERAQAILKVFWLRNKASIRVTDLSRKEEIQALLEASDSPLSPSGRG